MLSNSSVKIGTNLSEILVNNNIKLTPKKSTLLELLCTQILNRIYTTIDKREYIEHIIQSASIGDNIIKDNVKSYSQSSHDLTMDNYVEDLSMLVSKHVGFARNIVNKEITNLLENIEESLESYKFKDPEDFFSISYYKQDDVFLSSLIEKEILAYNTTNSSEFINMNLSSLQNQEFDLLNYILIGDEEIDLLIKSWYNRVGSYVLKSYVFDKVLEFTLSTPEQIDYSFINYLFYRNVVNKTDLNIGYSTIQLRTNASKNRDYFGKKLNLSLDMYKKEIQRGKVLTSNTETNFSYLNKDPLRICIYEDSFSKLAENGVNIEVILGYITSENKNDVLVNKLIEEKEKYIQKWMSVRNLYSVYSDNSKLEIYRVIITNSFEKSILNLTEEEKEYFNNSTSFIDETRKLSNEYISNLKLEDLEDLEKISLDLVAKIRFRFSSSYFILNEMRQLMLSNENMQPQEAALYSCIKYVTDFMLDQFSKENILLIN